MIECVFLNGPYQGKVMAEPTAEVRIKAFMMIADLHDWSSMMIEPRVKEIEYLLSWANEKYAVYYCPELES